MDDRHGYIPYSVPPTSSRSNGTGSRDVPGHAPLSAPHPQPPPGAAAPAPYYGSAAAQYAPYPSLFGSTSNHSNAPGRGGTFSPATTSGSQSRSGSIAGGMQSEASSSGNGAAAVDHALPDMTVSFTMEKPSVGGQAQGPSKRARSDDTASGLSSGGTPKGLTDKACKTCRVRKVKCDRRWPKCQRCKDRGEECDFGSMVPVDVITDLPALNADPRVAGLENQVVVLQMQLADQHRLGPADAPLTPNPALADAIRSSFLSGTRDAHVPLDRFLIQHLQSPLVWGGSVSDFGGGIGEHSLDWQLARPQMAKALMLHLMHSFFSSCCSFLPIFDPWHCRLPEICAHIDHLDPANQVAVTAFCAMGARASPHSALLGIHDIGPADPTSNIATHATRAAGVRREQACRSLHLRTWDLCNDLDILHDTTPVNFEALMVELQMLIFNELIPRKSRTLVRLAFGQFQDLQNSTLSDEIKQELSRAYSMPLFTCDAVTSAYARKVPIITVADCRQYLDLSIPDFGVDLLERNMQKHIPPTLPKGTLTHEVLVHATHEVHAWLGQAQRTYAEMAVHRLDPVLLSTQVYALWRAVDQIHSASQSLQTTLINLDYAPIACGADGCNDLHLRFITRLDRDTMDITLLIHALVKERKIEGALGASLFLESEKRVRNALKLVSFYSELYITSRDPHMTYHLFWQLELLSDWSELAMQRFGEPGGPATEALECSEVELDWFTKGLSCAAYYHPIAMGRLRDMEKKRRPPRQSSTSVVSDSLSTAAPNGTSIISHHDQTAFIHTPSFVSGTTPHPPLTQVYPHPQVSPHLGARVPPVHSAAPTSGLVGAARASGTTLVAPVSAAMAAGQEIIGGDLQSGVTNPGANKQWGDWSGDIGSDGMWRGERP